MLGAADVAHAALWRDVTNTALGNPTAGWTNKVELADINGDGLVDLLFANGGNYNEPGDPTTCGVWINEGPDSSGAPRFADRSTSIVGEAGGLARVIKAGDLDRNGTTDLVIGHTYETQSRLLLGDGNGGFVDRSDLLPQVPASIGDLELGDIDDDGDLDLVLADWGLGDDAGALLDPFTAPGGRTMLWRNELTDGTLRFTDATATAMPDTLVAWSWELELIDVEGDFDLDVLVSCKACTGSFLFRNDAGSFTDDPTGLPQFTNNYDFEPMFIVPPGASAPQLAVITINDGDKDDPANDFDLREHIFVADARGKFTDATASLWPPASNVGTDDNMISVLDVDSDGDPDFLVAALGEDDDRLLVNDLAGSGTFVTGPATGLTDTPGTLGIALADLNGDGKLDVVQSQGELADPEKVWVGDEIAPDTAKPVVLAVDPIGDGADGPRVRARVHDNKSPNRPHDWRAVEVRWSGATAPAVPMQWQGEFLFSAALDAVPEMATAYRVCAIDAAGNEGCSDEIALSEDDKFDDLGGDDAEGGGEGCGCTSDAQGSGALALGLVVLLAIRRRSAR
jgi:MYXO-CTERM domain-containing protein